MWLTFASAEDAQLVGIGLSGMFIPRRPLRWSHQLRAALLRGYCDALDAHGVPRTAMYSYLLVLLCERHVSSGLETEPAVFIERARCAIEEHRADLQSADEMVRRCGPGIARAAVAREGKSGEVDCIWRLLPEVIGALGESAGSMELRSIVRAVLAVAYGARQYEAISREWEMVMASSVQTVRKNKSRLLAKVKEREEVVLQRLEGLAQDAPEERDRSAFESFRLSLRNQLWAMGDRRA